jgi:elongation factor Ts
MNNTEMIRELRALTQAGMKDCKESLEEAGWDLQKAVDIVKTKGLNVVSGREGKVAAEGLVGIDVRDNFVSMAEVNCQTDFVAKNPAFIRFSQTVPYGLSEAKLAGETFSADGLTEIKNNLISTLKENIVIRRWWLEEALVPTARVFHYLHSNSKIGVLLTLLAPSEEAANSPEFTALGNDLAMQVAAMNPVAVSVDRLKPDELTRQKGIFEAQLAELKKPQAAWPKILDGKLGKWYSEVCLLNQESVVIPKTTINQVVKNVGTKLGGEIQIVNFIRCQVGEGIEVKKADFLQDVQQLSGFIPEEESSMLR